MLQYLIARKIYKDVSSFASESEYNDFQVGATLKLIPPVLFILYGVANLVWTYLGVRVSANEGNPYLNGILFVVLGVIFLSYFKWSVNQDYKALTKGKEGV